MLLTPISGGVYNKGVIWQEFRVVSERGGPRQGPLEAGGPVGAPRRKGRKNPPQGTVGKDPVAGAQRRGYNDMARLNSEMAEGLEDWPLEAYEDYLTNLRRGRRRL